MGRVTKSFLASLTVGLVLVAVAACVSRLVLQEDPIPQRDPSSQHEIVELYSEDRVNAANYRAPLVYDQWWAEVAKCVGLAPDLAKEAFARLKWFRVEGDGFTLNGEGPFLGLSDIFNDQNFIVALYATHEGLIKHEMLHYAMWHLGKLSYSHPSPPYETCAPTYPLSGPNKP